MSQDAISQPQTLQAIQKQHEELLSQYANKGEIEVEQVQLFLKTISQAGKSIEKSQERSALRDLMRYWSVIVDDKTGELPLMQLQPFDSSLSLHSTPHGSKITLQDISEKTTPTLSPQNRQRLLKRVRNLWIDGVLNHSLYQTTFISPELYEQPYAVANPWLLEVQETDFPLHPFPSGTSIAEIYDRASGELLILGAPGSGKTTLLLELASVLLERAEKDESYPISLVFNLSSWATNRRSLNHWLIEEMKTKYQVPSSLARALMDSEQILPLLDGLDEVISSCRSECIDAINTYLLHHELVPLVVCSRSAEYMALTSRMLLHKAVEVQPLTLTQIDTYLFQAGKDLEAVALALHKDTILQELATTPLMLNVLTLAYAGKSVQALSIEDSLEARRRKIFDTYIERMLHRRNRVIQYPKERTLQRLAWLARQMKRHHQTVFYIEELQPDWLAGGWSSIAYLILTGLIFGIATFLAFGAFIGLFIEPSFALMAGLIFGAAIGIIGGLIIGLRGEALSSIQPIEGITWSFKSFLKDFFPRLRRGLKAQLLGALVFGLLWGLISGVFIGGSSGLRVGLIGGLVIGLLTWLFIVMAGGAVSPGQSIGNAGGILESFRRSWLFLQSGGLIAGVRAGLVAGLSNKPLNVDERITPNQGIWRSARYATILALTFALVFGSLFGFIGWLIFGPDQVLHFALSGVISSALLGALIFGGEACVKHLVLRLLLWQAGTVPWNYPSFLDYATERILLRKVGGGYIFIHSLILDYFAELVTQNTLNTIQLETDDDLFKS